MNGPVIAHFDGLCEPRNPGGYACGGWVVLAHPDVPALARPVAGCAAYEQGDGATNNVAEYQAALDALRAVYRLGWRGPVVLRGDSQLVVRQVMGEWACNKDHLRQLRDEVRRAMTYFDGVSLEWVPREQNEAADAQSRAAYRQARQGGAA